MTDNTFTRVDLAQFDGHTPGPWSWFGNTRCGGFYLATKHSGRIFVMTFERMGMQGAQPLFQVDNVMVGGRDLCRYEVAPDIVGVKAARKSGSGVYREDITEFDHDDARLIAAAPDLLAALRAAYAEIDRLRAELTTRSLDDIPLTAQQRRGLVLLEGLTKFLEGVADAGKPMTTQLVIRDTENGDEFPIIHLWATVDDQDPVAKNRYLREENDNLKAEIDRLRAELNDAWMESGHDKATIDRLRANALEWVTVTKDLATLPEKGRPVLIRTGRYYFAGYRNPGKTKCWVINPKESSCDTSHLFVGDRWAYIPEAQA